MTDQAGQRIAKWLVGERLSCVLHVGDGAIAYTLAAQGHDVVVAGDDVRGSRHPDVQYVRTSGDRLPFTSAAFDAVVAPSLDDAPGTLAEYARVLRPSGLVSAIGRRQDESVPWVRRMREILERPPRDTTTVETVSASGLYEAVETLDVAGWEQLDLAGVLQLARVTAPGVSDDALSRVRALFAEYASGTGFLRLRLETHCVRARVDKSALPSDVVVAETSLIDLR